MQKSALYFIALTCFLGLYSCKKNYLDINQNNPNQTQNPPINALLANVTYQTGINVNSAGNVTSYYVQYLASPNEASGSDIYEDVDRSSLWGSIYDVIQDSRVMKTLAAEKAAYQHIGVANITEAMNISLLIDLFGDAPYTQAWNKDILKPAYDNAQSIYDSCLKLIDEGIAAFNTPEPGIVLDPANDMIHGASPDEVQAWVKTGYALKARLLNRLSKTAAYDANAVLQAVSNAYTSNADDAQLTQFEGLSPWNEAAVNNASLSLDGWLSTHFVNALNGTTFGVTDPRLKYITDTTQFGDYRGTINGAGRIGTGTDNEESYLSVNGFYSKSGAPLLLITYAEMQFIKSEATFAADKTTSYHAYLNGIKGNMDKLNVNEAEQNIYLSNPTVAVGITNFTKDLTFKEKYVAMFLQPETWTDARRYDYQYKDFTLPQNALLPTFIRRAGYPTTETSRNAQNVPAVGSLADKLWWDQ